MEINRGLTQLEMFPEAQMPLFKNRRKIIIEGGEQGSWSTHTIHPLEADLPEEVNKISFYSLDRPQADYTLHLVRYWRGNEISSDNPDDLLKMSRGEEYRFRDYFTIQRPTSVITVDGRIFFDTALIADPVQFNRQRLDIFLKMLQEKSGGLNPVEEMFTKEGRKKYADRSIEFVNPPEFAFPL